MFLASDASTQAVYTSPARKVSGKRSPAPYLLSHRNSFLFRIRVPSALQNCLGRKEYRRSLGPCHAAEAKVKSLRLAAAAHEVFAFARQVLSLRLENGEGSPAPEVVYTRGRSRQEEMTVSQGNHAGGNGYTALRGRDLETLTNEEIRVIENNTIKTYCQSVTTFINWAARREYHNNPNIAGLLQVKAEKQPHEFRDPYTDGDILKLFAPEHLTRNIVAKKSTKDKMEPDSGGKPSRFWIPLLGLFFSPRHLSLGIMQMPNEPEKFPWVLTE